jgi:hypothetical protein
VTATPTATPATINDPRAAATQKLDALDTAVTLSAAQWGPKATIKTRDASVSQNEERVLQNIEPKDSATDISNALDALATAAETNLKLTKNGAEAAVSQLVARLNAAPITIAVPGWALFGAGVPKGSKTQYKAATEQCLATDQTGALGKGDDIVHHVGAFKDPVFVDERGEDYLRFRIWKDRLMAHNMGVSAEEMPNYGAMNLNWDINYSTSSNTKLNDLSQGQRDLRSADWTKHRGQEGVGEGQQARRGATPPAPCRPTSSWTPSTSRRRSSASSTWRPM